MKNRPPTDYLINVLNDEQKSLIVPSLNIDDEEALLTQDVRNLVYTINSLIGRNALNENDIRLIAEQAKKEAGL